MKMLGLNPTEQEVVDIPNNVARYVDQSDLGHVWPSSDIQKDKFCLFLNFQQD